MNWDEIYKAAIDKGCGEPELKVKDAARYAVQMFALENDLEDPERAEIPEEVVEEYCDKFNIVFEENGEIASYDKNAVKLQKILDLLEEEGCKVSVKGKYVGVEFWTDTAGQDIVTEFDFDGTAEDFIKQFSERAKWYDVDDEVELFAGMRGRNGVPDSIRELTADCQEAKDTLMSLSEKIKGIEKKDLSFADDAEKMRDFVSLTSEEFLSSYSYLTEAEYKATLDDVMVNNGVPIINAALELVDRDDAAALMSSLLMDDEWSTYTMFESLAADYVGGNVDVREGINLAVSALTGWKFDSIAKRLLIENQEEVA